MSKVVRLSDKTISVLNQYRAFKCTQFNDSLIKKGFLDMSDDDLIRIVFEDLLELNDISDPE